MKEIMLKTMLLGMKYLKVASIVLLLTFTTLPFSLAQENQNDDDILDLLPGILAASKLSKDHDGDGYSETQGDCNDTNPAISPGSTEICSDGIDQDCSGTDSLCPYDIDDDNDRYTENQGDCNDEDSGINPGALEICGDGIDQDCSSSDQLCAGERLITKIEEREIWEYLTYEQQPPHIYAGVEYPAVPVSFFVQGHITHDFWADGNTDILIPVNKGYASGIDTRFKPLIFKNTGTQFIESSDEVLNEIPSIPGIRRSYSFTDEIGVSGVFGVAHDTGDNRSADAFLLTSGDVPENQTLASIPTLPLAGELGRTNAVDAHAMAGGDINGDGLTDFIVGEWRDDSGPYFLVQNNQNQWEVRPSSFLQSLLQMPLVNPGSGEGFNLLIDLHLADFNSDGFDDLVVGFGHGSANSLLFINDGLGGFSHNEKRTLPESIYGIDNTLHLRTFSLDKDKDGDLDLLIVHSRYEPYYGGYAFQLLINDGSGQFSDATSQAFTYINDEHFWGPRLEWTDNFYLMDVNQDNKIDIIGSDLTGARLWLGSSGAEWKEIPVSTYEEHIGKTHIFNQMGDGSVHALVFQQSWIDSAGTANKVWVDHISLQGDFVLGR